MHAGMPSTPPVLPAAQGARGRRLSVAAVRIQAAWRGMEARQLLRRSRAAATVIQAAWRGHVGRQRAQRLRQELAATRLQAAWRMHRQRAAFQLHRRWVRGTAGILLCACCWPEGCIQAAWMNGRA